MIARALRAEVIDSVLYENSNSQGVNVASAYAGSGISITNPSAGDSVNKNSVTFEWSADANADTYRICWAEVGEAATCISTPSGNTSYSPNPSALKNNTNYRVYVESWLNGSKLETSPNVTFET